MHLMYGQCGFATLCTLHRGGDINTCNDVQVTSDQGQCLTECTFLTPTCASYDQDDIRRNGRSYTVTHREVRARNRPRQYYACGTYPQVFGVNTLCARTVRYRVLPAPLRDPPDVPQQSVRRINSGLIPPPLRAPPGVPQQPPQGVHASARDSLFENEYEYYEDAGYDQYDGM